MKILFCQTQFKMGGQQKAVLTIAEGLRKSNDVTIYYENYNYFGFNGLKTIQPSKLIQMKNLIHSLGYNLFKLDFKKKLVADYWHILNLRSTLKFQEYDVVILVNPYILFVDEIRKLVNAKKIICWTHNLYDTYVDKYFKYEKKQLFLSMAHADLIVCLEEYTGNKWRNVNSKTLIIENAIGLNVVDEIKKHKNKNIGLVARIDIEHKGLDYFCELVSKLDKDINVFLVGSGSKKEEKNFLRLEKEHQVENRINRLGSLSYDKMSEFYKTLSVFVMTSRHEGFPLVAIEAMANGVPVVGFDIPALRAVTVNQKYGKLIPYPDTDIMAKYINQLINNKNNEEFEEHSKLSITRAKQLTSENIIQQWEKEVLKLW